MFFDINFLNDKSKRSFSRKIAAVSFILKQKPIFSFLGHVLLSAILRSIVSNHCISLHGRWSSCSPDVNVDNNDTDRTMLYYWVPGIRLFMPYHFFVLAKECGQNLLVCLHLLCGAIVVLQQLLIIIIRNYLVGLVVFICFDFPPIPPFFFLSIFTFFVCCCCQKTTTLFWYLFLFR